MAEYFSHDYDAREDDKIIGLMSEMGWAGYGLYWGLVELMYKNNGRVRSDYNRLAFALSSHPDHVKELVEKYELFEVKKGFITNASIEKRLKVRQQKKQVASANARKRWEKDDAIAMQPQCKGNAKKDSKEKESKVNKEYKEFIDIFNRITGRDFKGTEKDKRQFSARIKEGFSLTGFEIAIRNCAADDFHKQNTKYLTPEFITRSDKFQKYLNANSTWDVKKEDQSNFES